MADDAVHFGCFHAPVVIVLQSVRHSFVVFLIPSVAVVNAAPLVFVFVRAPSPLALKWLHSHAPTVRVESTNRRMKSN